MISKEENDRMDQELMDIVNSHSHSDVINNFHIIKYDQVNYYINNKKYYLKGSNFKNETDAITLQEKSVSGNISKKKYGLAKAIVIAGVVITVVGSFSYYLSNLSIDGNAKEDSADTLVVEQVSGYGDFDAKFGDSFDEKLFLSKDSFLEPFNNSNKNLVDDKIGSDEFDKKYEENSDEISYDFEIDGKEDEYDGKKVVNIEDSSLDKQISRVDEIDISSQIEESKAENENSEGKNVSSEGDVVFDVGTSIDIDDTKYYLENTLYGFYIRKYSEMYGLDPKIIAAICFQESGGVNIVDGGAAIGIMMLEDMPDYDITVYNYIDGCYESLTVSSSMSGNPEYNIRCGIANMQNKLNYFDGCMYAALQAYNYSEYTLQNALDMNGYSLNGINDYNWLYITEDVTNNPQKYGISALDENGEEIYPKYGVSYYPCYTGYHLIDEVIKYNYISDGEIHEAEMNFATATVIKDNVIDYVSEKSL